MKHIEFIQKIKELGLKVYDLSYYGYFAIDDEYGEVAWVSKDNELVLGSEGIIRLSKELRAKLFDVLVKYARTPIEDR